MIFWALLPVDELEAETISISSKIKQNYSSLGATPFFVVGESLGTRKIYTAAAIRLNREISDRSANS